VVLSHLTCREINSVKREINYVYSVINCYYIKISRVNREVMKLQTGVNTATERLTITGI